MLTSALVIAPSAYIQAYATTVNAESDWAITKVTAKNPGSAPYCALARRFQNNIIMTIARNTRDETSVAIDFQQPVFNDGESVTLKLSAGNNPSRDFIVPPASKKAVVARIGADRAFFDEIARAGSLDVAVMGQQYSFQVPDMSDANTQISTCLVSLGNTQSFASNVDAPSGVDGKIEALQSQISSLQQERMNIAQQQSSATAYNNQLKSAAGSSGNEDLATKIAELQLQNITLRSKMDEQRVVIDNVQSSSLEDRSKLALLEETQDQLRRAEDETKRFRDQLYTAQNKQDTLLMKLERYSDEEVKRKELEQHLADLQREQKVLNEQYLEERSRLELVQSAQEAVLAQQKEELERTKVELAKTSEEKQALQGRLQEYSGIKDKLVSLAEEQKNLGQTVVFLKEEREDLASKLANEKARLEQTEKDRIALKTELEHKVNKSEEDKVRLQKLLDEERQNRDVVASLETELQDVQSKQEKLATQLKELETEKSDLQTRVVSLEEKVKDVEAKRLEAEAAQQAALAEKEKVALTLQQEQQAKAELQTQYASEQDKRKETSERLEQEKLAKAELETQYASEQDKRRDVVARLEAEAMRRAEIIDQMEAQAAKNKKLALTQEQSEEARQKAIADATRLKSEKEKLALDMQEIAKKREELAQALTEADTIIDTQMATIDTLTIKQKGLLSKVTSLETEKKDLLAQLDTSKAQLVEKESDTKTQRNSEYEIISIKEDLAKMSKERDELRQALTNLREENTKTARATLPQDEGMNKLYTQIEELEYQSVDLNSAIEFERELNNEAPASGDGDSSIVEMKAALAAMRAERDAFNKLLEVERAKTQKLESVVGPEGASKTTLAELTAKVKRLETDNVNLLRELEYEKTRVAGDVVTGDPVLANAGQDNSSDLTIMRLRNEVKRLSGQSQSLEKEQTSLLAQVRDLEAEKQKLAQSGTPVTTDAAETEALKQQITALKEEKDNLSRALSSKQIMADSVKPVADTPKIEISKVESSLAAQNAFVLEQKDAANREIQSLRAQLSQTQALLEAREAEKQQVQARQSVPVAQPIVDQAQYAAISPAARSADVESDLRTILQNASVTQPSEFGPVTIPVASNVQAWRWKSGDYAGNAEAHYAPDADTRNVMINEFLAKAKSRCPGDFAVIENSRTQSAGGLVVSSDIACVAGNNGVAAAIAFVQVDDQIVAISHEAPTSSLADAMTTRDEIVKSALARSRT